jgi:hypothetical protein
MTRAGAVVLGGAGMLITVSPEAIDGIIAHVTSANMA